MFLVKSKNKLTVTFTHSLLGDIHMSDHPSGPTSFLHGPSRSLHCITWLCSHHNNYNHFSMPPNSPIIFSACHVPIFCQAPFSVLSRRKWHPLGSSADEFSLLWHTVGPFESMADAPSLPIGVFIRHALSVLSWQPVLCFLCMIWLTLIWLTWNCAVLVFCWQKLW